MPELPEVESLAIYLRERAAGRTIDRADSAAISVLKTYRPDLTALRGRVVRTAVRHGKFLDLVAAHPDDAASSEPLHLVMHLARAGWLRWRENLPAEPPRPGKGPLAFRLRFTDGAGFDLTEAGTQKRLAVSLVADPAEVPGVAALGPDPLADSFTVEVLAGLLAGRRTQIKGVLRDQKIIAGIGNAYSDEVLHTAKMSPFKLASSLTSDEVAWLHEAILSTLRAAIARSAGWPRVTSRRRRNQASRCTAGLGSRARSAGTRCARYRSPTRLSSTARRARPAASHWPTGGCRACSGNHAPAKVTPSRRRAAGLSGSG